jgi:hypothetical protein
VKARGLSDTGSFQILDDLHLDARLYRALERYVDAQSSGIDEQGVIQLALAYFLDPVQRAALTKPRRAPRRPAPR